MTARHLAYHRICGRLLPVEEPPSKLHVACPLPLPADRQGQGRADRRRALHVQPGSAVLGSITTLTRETLLHGSPAFLECS